DPAPRELLAIYADESCLGNGREGKNPGGAAGVIEWLSGKSGKLKRWDYWISEPATTNNRMALRSVIEALRGISSKGRSFTVHFTTDSRYIVDGMNVWRHNWKARGWTRKGGIILNLELWKQADAAALAHDVHCEWVKGHAGHPQNEYANYLAFKAAGELSASDGLRRSGFDEWMAGKKPGVKSLGQVATFPTATTFKGTRNG
ncbi:MAG: ribonuclease H family protein, partial [Gemmatimonadaceae bacterium]